MSLSSQKPLSSISKYLLRLQRIPKTTVVWPWRYRSSTRAIIGIPALLLLVALVVFFIWQGFQIVKGVESAQRSVLTLESIRPAENDLVQLLQDLPSLHGTLSQARDDLRSARSNLKIVLPFVPLAGWVPGLGSKASEGKELLKLGENLVDGALILLLGLEKVTAASNGPVLLKGRELNTRPLHVLSSIEQDIREAMAHFEEAEAIQVKLLKKDLTDDRKRLLSFSETVLPDLMGLAQMGITASQSWGAFLGFDEPRTYLLVAQNTDELRASGGYLPGAWLLTFDRGRIEQLKFWDTVDVDDLDAGLPVPPGGIVQSLWGGVWLFRDAGWNPDFPSSAQIMERLFRLGTGHSVNGVIAVDQWAVKEILEAIGRVRLPDGQEIDADSYLRALEQGKDQVGRVFMDTTLNGMLDGLEAGDSSERFASLMLALWRSLVQGHLLPYFHDEFLQERVLENGWGGAVDDSRTDYLMVVDSNVGWSKVNINIEREIEYLVTINPQGDVKARVDITYVNHSPSWDSTSCDIQSPGVVGPTYQAKKNACYWNYLRVYAPNASSIQSSSPFPMPAGAIYRRLGYNDIEETLQSFVEGGKTVFSGFFIVPAGETRRVTFAYELPASVLRREDDSWVYSLVVQKQLGTLDTPVKVTVTVPARYRIEGANPSPTILDDEKVQFLFSLNSISRLELVLRAE